MHRSPTKTCKMWSGREKRRGREDDAQNGEGPIDDEWSFEPHDQNEILFRQVLPFSLVVIIVKACKETDHSSDSTGECNAPWYLPHHHPENKTWHRN